MKLSWTLGLNYGRKIIVATSAGPILKAFKIAVNANNLEQKSRYKDW